MTSRHVRPLLSAYLDGEVTPAERAQVERHLASCPECARVLAQYREQGAGIRELSRPTPPLTLHSDVWTAIERREHQATPWGVTIAGLLRGGAVLAVAVLAVVVAVTLWINRPSPQLATADLISPLPGQASVPRYTGIVIGFGKPVASDLAPGAVVALNPVPAVPPHTAWGAERKQLYVDPGDGLWAPNTTYTVTVLTTTRFADNSSLPQPLVWHFTTGSALYTPTLTPSVTPVPSNTPVPTDTPLPSVTPEPATPAPTAVAQASPPSLPPPPATVTEIPPTVEPPSSTPEPPASSTPEPPPSSTPAPPEATATSAPPSATPEVSATPTAEPPSATAVVSATPTGHPSPTVTVTGTPTGSPTVTPTIPPGPMPIPATPSPTVAPAGTGTPTPTAGSATPTPAAGTATATPTGAGCTSLPQGPFGQVYRSSYAVRDVLGCPTSAEQSPSAAVAEAFEHGLMYWDGDTLQIYVFDDNAMAWFVYADTWQDGDPPSGTPTPPAGLYTPVRGFAKLWNEQPDVRQRLGWATEPESPVTGVMQTFEHGTMLRFDPTTVRILYPSHQWERFTVGAP